MHTAVHSVVYSEYDAEGQILINEQNYLVLNWVK
jgi:hypothetical protein